MAHGLPAQMFVCLFFLNSPQLLGKIGRNIVVSDTAQNSKAIVYYPLKKFTR
jgi:hypothetical protein